MVWPSVEKRFKLRAKESYGVARKNEDNPKEGVADHSHQLYLSFCSRLSQNQKSSIDLIISIVNHTKCGKKCISCSLCIRTTINDCLGGSGSFLLAFHIVNPPFTKIHANIQAIVM